MPQGQGLFDEMDAASSGAEESVPVSAVGPFAHVALDLPLRREFSYRIPQALVDQDWVGCRVQVPFASRRLFGVVVGVEEHPPKGVPVSRLKAIGRVLDREPLLPLPMLRLAKHMADQSFCAWGQALAAMLPAALRKDRPRRSVATVEMARTPTDEELEELAKRFPKQEKALAWLQRAGGPVEVRNFLGRTGLSKSPLDSLAKKGWVRFARRREFFDPFAESEAVPDVPPTLTQPQETAITAIRGAIDEARHADFLLYGITGSGKTEVYLRALERCLELGKGAIILVPEIALTPQTVARFRARCSEIAVLHSGLTDAERHDQWQSLRSGRLRVVVGARSALFAPVPNLGLIVVDEEHETSFRQENVPRYHAPSIARERAHIEEAVCILGSATPSLELWHQAQEGKLELLSLPERVAGGSLPPVEVVDMCVEKPPTGQWLVVAEPLRRALEQCLKRKERAILFLNRRGFAPAWHCRACGSTVKCPTCDVAVVYHRWRKRAMCHSCLSEHPTPTSCKDCRSAVSLVGVGTERAEDSLQRLFPSARIARMDRDTMVRRESYEKLLAAFGQGEYDFLLGTQMVAKGLDFPEVTVVGVLDADTALHQPDFRASERCFDLLAQVSGRAGRSSRGGQVVVQTWLPEHFAIQHASRHDFQSFAKEELRERKAFQYPPFGRLVRVLIEDEEASRADKRADAVADQLRAVEAPGVTILGPAPPPIERIRKRWRRQILIKSPDNKTLRPLLPLLFTLSEKLALRAD